MYSRWQKGPTSFGALGRLAITLGIVVVGAGVFMLMTVAWPFALWFLMGYSLMTGMVLRQVWQPQRVSMEEAASSSVIARLRRRIASRSPGLAREISPRVGLVVASVIAGGGVVVAWSQGADIQRFFLVAVLICAGVGIFFAWFNDF